MTCRQIDIHPAAEPDQSEPLANANSTTIFDKHYDTPRHKPRNLHNADLLPLMRFQDQGTPLIVVARLIQGGIQKQSGRIDRTKNFAGHWRSIYMHIENRQKNRNTDHRLVTELEIPKWRNLIDRHNQPIGGADHKPLAQWSYTIRIAKKIGNIDGQKHADPAQRRPQQKEEKRYRGRARDILMPVTMNRHEAGRNRIEQAGRLNHFASLGSVQWDQILSYRTRDERL
ncbi:hypothetical protein MnTg02_01482 [bacterium MnTg02]|nr:hypothetical protein MnTg02_01482 [bacterium MnTg02]